MGLRMKKFNIMGVKNPFFRMRSWKTNIYWGRGCQKGDWYPNVHYDFVNLSLKYFSPLPIQRSSHLIRTIMCPKIPKIPSPPTTKQETNKFYWIIWKLKTDWNWKQTIKKLYQKSVLESSYRSFLFIKNLL